jgi:hypothetical protein
LQQQAGGLALRAESPAPKVSVRRTPRSPGAPAKTEACARQDKTRQGKKRQDKTRQENAIPGSVIQLRVSYVMSCPEPVLASENSSEEKAFFLAPIRLAEVERGAISLRQRLSAKQNNALPSLN